MSNYTKTTDFEAKDSLPSGNTGKIIRGSEFETEFDNISTAIATKADLASPTFSGTINITSASINDGSVTISGFLDEDTMATNSASHVPTQQSVKAYVDSQTAGIVTDTDTQTLTNKTLTSPVINTGVSGTAVLDEDDMFSDSDTKLATQQSIKAYVDSQTASVSLTGIDDNATGTRLIVSDDGIAVGNTGANPTAVNGTIAVNATASSGAEFIAGTNDTVISSGAFMGGYIFKNADSTGTPPHYSGMWAESADTSGNMNLYFAAGSTGYETGSPDLTIDSIGNVGIGTDTPEDILNSRTLEIRGVDGASIELGADTTKHGSLYSGAWGVSLSALGSRELQFRTNGTERASITDAGLAVTGDISATGDITLGDTIYAKSNNQAFLKLKADQAGLAGTGGPHEWQLEADTSGNLSVNYDKNGTVTNDVVRITKGTSSSEVKLDVPSGGSAHFCGFSTDFGFRIQDGGVGGKTIRLVNNGTSVFRHNQVEDLVDLSGASKTEVAKLNISNIPTSASGLSSGDVWNDSGTLKIVT